MGLLLQKRSISAAQKMKFSIKDYFSKCDQIRSFLRIWSHLLQKSLMENFIFCAACLLFSQHVPSHVWHIPKYISGKYEFVAAICMA